MKYGTAWLMKNIPRMRNDILCCFPNGNEKGDYDLSREVAYRTFLAFEHQTGPIIPEEQFIEKMLGSRGLSFYGFCKSLILEKKLRELISKHSPYQIGPDEFGMDMVTYMDDLGMGATEREQMMDDLQTFFGIMIPESEMCKCHGPGFCPNDTFEYIDKNFASKRSL
ncbi:MAG: hypothetical protein JW754_05820 [Candidatus Aenigmarchaeota archaeon]|nr:hypothetical protein [Candidatus Aenigmarchaeota archaeon]